MLRARCSKCGEEFDFDPTPQMTAANEIAKFADAVTERTWRVLFVCPKCGHRRHVEIGEDDGP